MPFAASRGLCTRMIESRVLTSLQSRSPRYRLRRRCLAESHKAWYTPKGPPSFTVTNARWWTKKRGSPQETGLPRKEAGAVGEERWRSPIVWDGHGVRVGWQHDSYQGLLPSGVRDRSSTCTSRTGPGP
jgi:hypothetical protein